MLDPDRDPTERNTPLVTIFRPEVRHAADRRPPAASPELKAMLRAKGVTGMATIGDDGTAEFTRWKRGRGRPDAWETKFTRWCTVVLTAFEQPAVTSINATIERAGEQIYSAAADKDSTRASLYRDLREVFQYSRPQFCVVDTTARRVFVSFMRPYPMLVLDRPGFDLRLRQVWHSDGRVTGFADEVLIGFTGASKEEACAAVLLFDQAHRSGTGCMHIAADAAIFGALPSLLKF